jgi:hypothetical protein
MSANPSPFDPEHRWIRPIQWLSDAPFASSLLVVNAIPEPLAARNFVLPLRHCFAVDLPGSEGTSKGVLVIVASPRVRHKSFPGNSGIGRRRRTHALPPRHGIARRIPQVPSFFRGRRRDAFSALGHPLARGASTELATQGAFDRKTRTIGRLRIGVDLGRGPPLPHELADRRVVVQLGRGRDGVRNSATNDRLMAPVDLRALCRHPDEMAPWHNFSKM